MTGAMANILDEILDGAAYPSDRHRTALHLAVKNWGMELTDRKDRGWRDLSDRIKAAWREDLKGDGYGSIMIFALLVIASAAIEWAVGRLLDWLWPKNTLLARRANRLMAAKGAM